MSWDNLQFNPSEVDDLLKSIKTFESDTSGHEDFEQSPKQSASTSSSPSIGSYRPDVYTHGGFGNHDRQEGRLANSTHRSMGGNVPVVNVAGTFPEKNASAVIGQLSQLSVHLASLRSSSHTLEEAAESALRKGSIDAQLSLIDSAAFESVAAWLAHEESSAYTESRRSVHFLPENPVPWPNNVPQIPATNDSSILKDVFSASHRLMEIVRHLQADDITRHLVMACEALLLETYASLLTVLQHEVHPNSSTSAALGNMRLVLVVQLCAYLIERQHQAVEQCLSPVNVQKHNIPTSLLGSGSTPLGGADRECLKGLKAQVQQKLTRLRQLLHCS
jgi:hypothetical protein